MSDLIIESQTTVPDAIVELVEIDFATRLSSTGSGPAKLFFTNEEDSVSFGGDVYISTSISFNSPAVGLDRAPSKGGLTIFGQSPELLSALNSYQNKIRGATVFYKQTHAKFLDSGSEPDPTQVFVEKYIVEAIKSRTKNAIELELSVGLSLDRLNQPALREVMR